MWLTVALVAVTGTTKFPAASVDGVVTASVDWTPEPLGVMDDGLKVQAAPKGNEPQLRFTAELNPPLAFSVRVNFAAPPGSTVCMEGAELIVKSGGAPAGVTENALGSVVPALPSGTLVTVTLRGPSPAVETIVILATICVAELGVQEITVIPAPKLHTVLLSNPLPAITTVGKLCPCAPNEGFTDVAAGWPKVGICLAKVTTSIP
jgi:hypothetical protein